MVRRGSDLVTSPLRRVTVGPYAYYQQSAVEPMAQAALLISNPVHLPKIALVEQPADHLRRDVFRTVLVNLVAGRELELTSGAGQRSLEGRYPTGGRKIPHHP
jgi:hypothetical protein